MNKSNTKNKGYTAANLSAGERVIFTTGPSKWSWVGISTVGMIAIGSLAYTVNSSNIWIQIPGYFMSVIFGLAFLQSIIYQYTTEFVVTNKKIVSKRGWIARKTDELLLKKTEGLDVEQGIQGRILGFGTVSFSGTGSQKVIFDMIDNPLEAKKQIEPSI